MSGWTCLQSMDIGDGSRTKGGATHQSVTFCSLLLAPTPYTSSTESTRREWVFMNGREMITCIPIVFILRLLQAPSGHSAAHVGAADAKSSPRTSVGKVSANVTKLYFTKAHVFNTTWPSTPGISQWARLTPEFSMELWRPWDSRKI